MTHRGTLHERQLTWLAAARSHVSAERLRDLIVSMVEIPSPTGDELPLAGMLTSRLASAGMRAATDVVEGRHASAVAELNGSGSGPDLLLYAPIDTYPYGDARDLPGIGEQYRYDMTPTATIADGVVVGLGASNPKGQAACVVAAAEALAAADIPLRGSIQVGLGGGGMPLGGEGTVPAPHGHGTGCAHILDHVFHPDMAVIAKPSKGVLWEEVGLAWVKISVSGAHSYAGTRHRGGYHNPILLSQSVIDGLETFFAVYTAATTDGQVAPQGNITAIQAGWPEKLAYIPARCDLYVDLRLSPHLAVADSLGRFEACLAEIAAAEPELDLSSAVITQIPGSRTEPTAWIVESAIAAWEHIEQRPHQPPEDNSGSTDANVLRGRGIPTARLGTPRLTLPAPLPDDFAAGMNTIDVRMMEALTAKLLYIAIDTCTRDRHEVGLE
jgi:acetylornithine deacetylase/succinyl-diaminopimelate desuccinylase-like protein